MTPLKDYPDAQKEIEIVPVNAIPSVVVDYPDFQREVEVIAGSEGMAYEGTWNREAGYAKGAVVRYKGKAYVCINGINAVPSETIGLGPPAGALEQKLFFFSEGRRVAPTGLIFPGEEIAGFLTTKSPAFEQYNFGPFRPYRAAVWQVNLREAEANAEVSFAVQMSKGMPGTLGAFQAYWANDAGEQTTFSNVEIAGNKFHELLKVLPSTTKLAGIYRFYLVVFGGLWQHIVKGEFVNTVTLPLPYSQTLTGAPVAEGPGNGAPSEDFQHWALLAGA